MVTSARLRTLGDLTRDFVQQISDENVALDQRHFRLLLNLSAAEKVMIGIMFLVYCIRVKT